MDLHQLRTFVAVARAGHLTRAAERLYLSQPAASAHIKALEEELKLALFHRKPSGLQLTQAGHLLLARAERLLIDADGLLSEARQLTGKVIGRLRLGCIPDGELVRFGPLMADLRAANPLLEVLVQQRNSFATIEGVRNGELDAGFALTTAADSSITVVGLVEIDYVVAAATSWAETLRRADLRSLASMPWVLPPLGGSHDQMYTRLFRSRGLEPTPALRVDNEGMIYACVVSGVGLGLLRRDIAERAEGEGRVILAREHHVAVRLLFAHLAERRGDPIITTLAASVARVWEIPAQTAQASPSISRNPL